jgi:hypothetical protein
MRHHLSLGRLGLSHYRDTCGCGSYGVGQQASIELSVKLRWLLILAEVFLRFYFSGHIASLQS